MLLPLVPLQCPPSPLPSLGSSVALRWNLDPTGEEGILLYNRSMLLAELCFVTPNNVTAPSCICMNWQLYLKPRASLKIEDQSSFPTCNCNDHQCCDNHNAGCNARFSNTFEQKKRFQPASKTLNLVSHQNASVCGWFWCNFGAEVIVFYVSLMIG